MGRLGSRGEMRSPLTKFKWLFRYPRSEPDCMTWLFPRQINLPHSVAARSDAAGSIAQLAVATAARPGSPIVGGVSVFRRFLTAFCCSRHHPVRRIASPLWAPASRASQATRGSPDRAEGHRHKVRKCTGASSAWPRLAIDFAVLRFFRQRPDPPLKQPRKG